MAGSAVTEAYTRGSARVREPDSGVRLRLLKGFELTCDGRRVRIEASAQRLVAFLATHDHSLPRPYVAGALWPDAPELRAAGNLRSALWRLRVPGLRIVDAVDDHLQIAAGVTVDLRRAVELARALEVDGAELPDEDLEDLPFSGPLLPGWYDDWLILERERQRQIRLHALEALCERLAAKRRFGQAIQAGLAAVDDEPLRESAHRALIRAYLAEGSPGEAIRQYRLYARLLDRELQLRPTGEIIALVAGLGMGRARAETPR